ncbi:MAG: hypothetical protein U1E31_02275 [Rickettsiales bacterium]
MNFDYVVLIDVGSYTISGSVISTNTKDKILAKVIIPSEGIQNGIIKNTRGFSNAITNVIKKLEKQINFNITKINLILSGCFTKSFYILTKFQITEEITNEQLEVLYKEAMKNFKRNDVEILKYYPIEFLLDSNLVDKPIGMIGKELIIRMHIIACDKSALDNMVYTLGRCHLEVERIFPSIYLSGLILLNEAELQQGTLLIDLGDSTITWGFFYNSLSYLNSINEGINFINQSILKDLNLENIEEARVILAKYATAVDINFSSSDELIYINQNQAITNLELYKIVSNCLDYLLEKVFLDLEETDIKNLIKKIYIIGGGANIDYIKQYITEFFNIPVGDINLNKFNLKDIYNQQDILNFLPHYGAAKYITNESLNNNSTAIQKKGFNKIFTKFLSFFE